MSEIQNASTDTAVAVMTAIDAVDAEKRVIAYDLEDTPDSLPLRLVTSNGLGENTRVELDEKLLAAAEARQASPRRRSGTHRVDELESFVALVNRFKHKDSAIWAEVPHCRLTAVFNEVPEGSAETAWRDYRAVYTCPLSPEWVLWKKAEQNEYPQDAFGDLIESRLDDLTSAPGFPKPNELLLMARNLQIVTKGTYSRELDPVTGNGHLICKQESEAVQSTVIPRAFLLAIPVFQGGDRYQVEARVRMKVTEGRPRFTFELHRRAELELDAFNDVRRKAAEGTGLPVFAGTP